MNDLIERQKAIDEIEERKNANGYRNVAVISELNRLEGYIMRLPSAQPKIEERKEESAQNVPKEDLISRKEAIEAMSESLKRVFPEHRQIAEKCLKALPSAQPELSDAVYQLWKRTYEAGERSAQSEVIKCEDCKHRGEKPISDGRYWCDIHDTYMYYCSDAERRTDE